MDELRVATLNVSWEANNANPRNYRPEGPPRGKRGFRLARDAEPPTHGGPKLGNAYEKDVQFLKVVEPDVILLQEFQVYPVRGTDKDSVEVLVDKDHLNDYTVVAKRLTQMRADLVPAACLVLVRTALIAAGIETVDQSSNWKDVDHGAFPRAGRPVAIADVVLTTKEGAPAPYRLISSHSRHGYDWTDRGKTQAYLDRFAQIKARAPFSEVPANLVWGGDFNCELSAAACKWNGKGAPLNGAIRKTSRSEMRGESTTVYDTKIDWVLGTTTSGRNPKDVVILPAASDHFIVAKTLQTAFVDTCI